MEEQRLIVSSAPHVHGDECTRYIMIDVMIALMPALIFGIFFFGWRALTITVLSTVTCVVTEFLYCRLMKKPQRAGDFSACVTGMLLAMNLPVAVPLWMPVVGGVFAILVVKQLFGGIGKNFLNPALAARVFLFSWAAEMTTFVRPLSKLSPWKITAEVDGFTCATPLASLKNHMLPDDGLISMFTGNMAGCIGETSALLLLAGSLFLLYRRIISWHTPVAFIGTVALLTYLFPRAADAPLESMLSELCSGGLMLGALFMATDFTTSPITGRGKFVFGVGCGLLTVFIRYFGGYPEGVSFAILVMNLFVWGLDKVFRPRRFGQPHRWQKLLHRTAAKKER